MLDTKATAMKIIKVVFILGLLQVCLCQKSDQIRDKLMSTSLLNGKDDNLLLASTLDGTLYALEMLSGHTRWQQDNEPAVKNPKDKSQPTLARFFPNPSDGSLYRYTLGNPEHPLKKLPFTIPQLVENSPFHSSEGIYYLGKKVDSYEVLNKLTGEKELVLDMQNIVETCATKSKQAMPTMYVGRTMYNILLYEQFTGNKWNVTFNDYTTHGSVADTKYDYIHYVSAGDGTIVTMDKGSEKFMWSAQFNSPIVALYAISDLGHMVSVPLTVVASSTLQRYMRLIVQQMNFLLTDHLNSPIKELSPSVFLGESLLGSTYAIPSLVDSSVVTIQRASPSVPLLEGPVNKPKGDNRRFSNDGVTETYIPGTPVHESKFNTNKCIRKEKSFESLLSDCYEDRKEKEKDVVVLGHYSIPEELREILYPMKPGSLPLAITYIDSDNSSKSPATDSQDTRHEDVLQDVPSSPVYTVASLFRMTREHFIEIFMLVVALSIAFMFYFMYTIKNSLLSTSRQTSSRNSNGMYGGEEGKVTAVPEDLSDGSIRVGKITYDPKQVLGHGSNGTVVFRGSFENRTTAVKRVLPNSYKIAEREVKLLQASDVHDYVVRYFCTEQCREFRYISLELCDATLDDYVHDKLPDCSPCPALNKQVMLQSVKGLAHLHKLGIVHRDIKPTNVLLQLPSSTEALRVRISDFGLCKQLEVGHLSFTKHSGITGTEGWIAPEMIAIELPESRPTRAVDIFSLGCVFYYIYSGGKHPYGMRLQRQNNIVNERRNLDSTTDKCFINLLDAMLRHDAQSRPPANALAHHPFLWSDDRALKFLSTTSDIVDKRDEGVISAQLAQDADCAAQNWVSKLDQMLSVDLRRHRDYRDNSVKDLLRALRNKFSHYHEMNVDMKQILGSPPSAFLQYWTSRFPDLLYCVWKVMHICREEEVFKSYYPYSYVFVNVTPCEEDPLAQRCQDEEEVKVIPPIKSLPNTRTGGTTSKSFKNYNEKRKKQASDLDRAFASALSTSAVNCGNWRANPISAPEEGVPAAPPQWIINRRKREPIFRQTNPDAPLKIPSPIPPNIPIEPASQNLAPSNPQLSFVALQPPSLNPVENGVKVTQGVGNSPNSANLVNGEGRNGELSDTPDDGDALDNGDASLDTASDVNCNVSSSVCEINVSLADGECDALSELKNDENTILCSDNQKRKRKKKNKR